MLSMLLLFSDFIDKSRATHSFLSNLCQGNLDIPSPDNSNIMAGPIKELQAQLSSLAWGMEQLADGKVVSKLLYSGKLFQSFNKLVDAVAMLSSSQGAGEADMQNRPVNSWRYHQLLSALNNLKIMVIEVCDSGKILYANRHAREYIGNAGSFAEGYNQGESVLLDYIAKFNTPKEKCPITKEMFGNDMKWYQITSDRAVFVDGSEGYMHVIDDISSWKHKERTLKEKAEKDQLTRLYNRHVGMRALENVISPDAQIDKRCVAFLDLDNLKKINDIYGHSEGDNALRTVAETIVSSVREDDIASRHGGDEFCIVFAQCGIEEAEKVMSRMNEKLDIINRQGKLPYTISFSYGLVEVNPEEDTDLADLLVKMDQKMYENKNMKKSRCNDNFANGALQ